MLGAASVGRCWHETGGLDPRAAGNSAKEAAQACGNCLDHWSRQIPG